MIPSGVGRGGKQDGMKALTHINLSNARKSPGKAGIIIHVFLNGIEDAKLRAPGHLGQEV